VATIYKIHPAIGIARLGNSPDDFFIGPERVGERPLPPGGFKDAQCRVKRQGARFRIYAHHDDGTVEEIDASKAKITWTVELANRKAAFAGRGNAGAVADLCITPGPRTLDAPDQRQLFDNGTIRFGGKVTTVPLGEIRSDTHNRLVVLGGSGTSASPNHDDVNDFWKNPGWYDDISDGPVAATLTVLSDNSVHDASGAWVIVAPPKFAPHQDSVMTLYDRLVQVMVTAGRLPAATTTSYTQDVYPILQRARDVRWVTDIPAGAMTWADPVTSDALRLAIFSSLKDPNGGGDDMPPLNPPDTGDPAGFLTDRLTFEQFGHMQRWKDDNYTNDWAGPPLPEASVSPTGLDRAALEACVGGSFYPGIEAGGLPPSAAVQYPGLAADSRPFLNASHYVEPFRLDHAALSAGAITAAMALPWQADFKQCDTNWWPVPRPEQVIRDGVSGQDWAEGIADEADMAAHWSRLGFVVQQGDEHVETERCQSASVTLLTPVLNFQDVPQGPMGMQRDAVLAISFEVISPSSSVTLEYAPGGAPSHPQLVAANTSDTVGPTPGDSIATARLWVIYKTSAVNDHLPAQTVTVQEAASGRQWTVTIMGNTVARKTSAVALVLDRSGSMADDRGDGQSKHASLQQAANVFVDLMLAGDGVGLVAFNQDATVLQPVTTLGDGSLSDLARSGTKDVINGNGLDPGGETSIGDGIFDGRQILDAAGASFDLDSMVVLTDGMENQPLWIADVAPQIDAFTYAVGLGQAQNISVPALQTISGNNGGYLLVTGAVTTDNRFLLQKYFLQILAGISNAEVVLDPDGQLIPGQVQRVPFSLTSEDAGVDVILLAPDVGIVNFRLQTPSGRIIDPALAGSRPEMRFVRSEGVSYYRITLPVDVVANHFDGAGTWCALLNLGRIDATTGRAQRSVRDVRALPYSIVVHAYSNLSLRARLLQRSFEPGATLTVSATLARSGLPMAQGVSTWADITHPDGTSASLALHARADASLSAEFVAAMPGVYRVRVRARGVVRPGEPFTREKTLTGAVWIGGDRSGVPRPGGSGAGSHGGGSGGGGCGRGGRHCCDGCVRLTDVLRCLLECEKRGGVIR
jgi:hypothetical protein